MEYKINNTSKKGIIISTLVVMAIFTVAVVWLIMECRSVINATKRYNTLVEKYNAISQEYDEILNSCSVDNIDGIPTEMGSLELEPEDVKNALKVVFGTNSEEKIENDIDTLQKLIEEVANWNIVIKQITAPSEEWVMERLKQIDTIKDVQAVSKNNNPDGLLGKESGYISCVYFSTELLNPNFVEGDTLIEKGTDAGGAIEVYTTLEDAEKRCDYLAQFDGTLLYSGSYAIVGTMVVRTSYMFSGKGQLDLTNDIVKAFTSLEEKIAVNSSDNIE